MNSTERTAAQERGSRAERDRAAARLSRIEDELQAAQAVHKIKVQFLDDFFDRKDKELYAAFNRVSLGDAKTLMEIHNQVKSLNALRMEVQSAVNTGKLAAKEKETGS